MLLIVVQVQSQGALVFGISCQYSLIFAYICAIAKPTSAHMLGGAGKCIELLKPHSSFFLKKQTFSCKDGSKKKKRNLDSLNYTRMMRRKLHTLYNCVSSQKLKLRKYCPCTDKEVEYK